MAQQSTRQLQNKITSLEKGKKYAWAKYFNEVNTQLDTNTQHYNRMKMLVEIIPTHIKDEYIAMLKELKKTIECPICMNVIDNNDLQLSNCGHKYCKTCFDRILTDSNKCAICKKQLKWK